MRATFSLFACAVLLASQAFAQCDGERFREFVFPSFTKTADILYGGNYTNTFEYQDLYLDVYTPDGDTETARPLVLLAHGGSFIFGSKDGIDVVPMAEDLAKMGYVVASIQYRLGLDVLSPPLQTPATEAVLRGYHDMKAAIRFFRKDVAENGNTYGIDPDQIYLAGVSAGGFITLHIQSMDQEEELPDYLDYTLDGLTGGLEGDSGNPGYSSEVAGVVNICGAVRDTSWMDVNDPPVLNFHGPNDLIVPYDADILYLLGTIPVTEVDGSAAVAEKANELGLVNCFEIYEGQGHTPHVENEAYYDTTLSITTNFLSHLICPEVDLDCNYRELALNIETPETTSLNIFPNPATDAFRLELPGSLRGTTVEIREWSGKVVRSFEVQSLNHSVPCGDLPRGVYLIKAAKLPEWTGRIVLK